MFPWFWWQLSPHYEFPLSGNVNQDMFFNAMPGAGDRRVEKKVFNTASYGRQLGWILEILLHLAGSKVVSGKTADESQKKLEDLYKHIDEIKQTIASEKIKEATDTLFKLRESEPDQFKKVLDHLTT